MSELIDRAGDAIMDACCDPGPHDWARLGRAAITAVREPTPAMLQLACRTHKPGAPMDPHAAPGTYAAGECPHIASARRRWQAMVDEALR